MPTIRSYVYNNFVWFKVELDEELDEISMFKGQLQWKYLLSR